MNTSLKNAVVATEMEAQYDMNVKEILSHKEVLAWILTQSSEEFEGMDPKEVVPLIEGEPEVMQVPVDPGVTNAAAPKLEEQDPEEQHSVSGGKINGMNTENSAPGEGMIRYDIVFKVRTFDGLIEIIVDVEPQKDMPSDYDILNRGIFYICRLISSQKNREFAGEDYNEIKRVYSIFICMNMADNTMSHFHLTEDTILGDYHWKGDRSLLNLVMIGLSKKIPPNKPEYKLHRLLGTMLSKTLPAAKKLEVMEEEYNIEMEEDYKKEVIAMGGFGHEIWKDGLEEGRQKGLQEGLQKGRTEGREEGRTEGIMSGLLMAASSLMRKRDLTAEEALEELDIPLCDREGYLAQL